MKDIRRLFNELEPADLRDLLSFGHTLLDAKRKLLCLSFEIGDEVKFQWLSEGKMWFYGKIHSIELDVNQVTVETAPQEGPDGGILYSMAVEKASTG